MSEELLRPVENKPDESKRIWPSSDLETSDSDEESIPPTIEKEGPAVDPDTEAAKEEENTSTLPIPPVKDPFEFVDEDEDEMPTLRKIPRIMVKEEDGPSTSEQARREADRAMKRRMRALGCEYDEVAGIVTGPLDDADISPG